MKIAILGYGKMGHAIERIALSRGHEIVAAIDVDNRSEIDSPAFASADVAIEFSNPTAAFDNCCDALRRGVAVVSGSTAWTDRLPEVRKLVEERGGSFIWSSNYSLGVNIFFELNRRLAAMMNRFPQYAPSMREIHHIHKLDHPSGTAITLAEEITAAVDRKSSWTVGTLTQPDGTVVTEGTPADDQLAIDSIRRGEVPGIHTISYDSDADCITITHDAHSRRGFALGAVLAAEFTATHSGLLTISDMFKF